MTSVLKEEITLKNYGAAPHELMSVVVALNCFPELFDTDEQKSFFARCILGYQYIKNLNTEKSFFTAQTLLTYGMCLLYSIFSKKSFQFVYSSMSNW